MSVSSLIVIRVFPFSAGTIAPRFAFEKSYSRRIIVLRTAVALERSPFEPKLGEPYRLATYRPQQGSSRKDRLRESRNGPPHRCRHRERSRRPRPQVRSPRQQTLPRASEGSAAAFLVPLITHVGSICTSYAPVQACG